ISTHGLICCFIWLLYVYGSVAPLGLPSFPTRRSSDLDEKSLLALANALPPGQGGGFGGGGGGGRGAGGQQMTPQQRQQQQFEQRSEEHTSELQSRENLVCRLLLEKKKDYID